MAIGPGYMTNQAATKINVRSPLYWVRNQLANHLKELMLAKKTGWQVLKNLKNQVKVKKKRKEEIYKNGHICRFSKIKIFFDNNDQN